MMRRKAFVAFFVLAVCGFAQRKDPAVFRPGFEPPSAEAPSGRTAALPPPSRYALPALTTAEAALLQQSGARPRIGVHRGLSGAVLNAGTWSTLPDGSPVWRLALRSPGATAIRLQFSGFSAGAGKVWVYAENAADAAQGPYAGRGLFDNGEFWSGSVFSDTAIVEYIPSDPQDLSIPFRIETLAHRVTARAGSPRRRQVLADAAQPPAPPPDPAASCNLDASCYSDWTSAMKMVAEIVFETEENGQKFEAACTAALAGTRDNSFKPYLLTAGHCINNEPDARTVETFWTYQTSRCGGPRPSIKDSSTSTTGAHYLASGNLAHGDYSLLLLKDVPAGVVFSGWDPQEIPIGTSVVGIHHPEASYKRILFGHRVSDDSAIIDGYNLPANLYYVVLLDKGISEPGSSGSPLFTSPGVIVGMLSYGPAAPGEELCAVGSFGIGYARFSNAYPYLKDWLEDLPYSQVVPSATDLLFRGANRSFPNGSQQNVTLTTQSANAVPFSARADAAWITVSTTAGMVSASSPASLSVSVNPQLLAGNGVYKGTVTILSGAAPPQFINVRVDMTVDASAVKASADPNPVFQDSDGLWSFTLSLTETAGVDTHVNLLRIDGVDYSSSITDWFGSNQLPANGVLAAPLKARLLSSPATQYIEIGGIDDASRRNWYRTVMLSLLPAH